MYYSYKGSVSIFLLLLSAMGVVMFAFTQLQRVEVKNYTQPKDIIRVFTPQPNADVYSPIEVTGEARGEWFFEASFPIRLLDANGNEIASATATAQGDWMTDSFVPFTATLSFSTPQSEGPLTIVLEKDNPSGLPENAASIQVPVQFTDNYNWVKVFFQNEKKNPNVIDCERVFPVFRSIPKGDKAVARAALGHLLGGPNKIELDSGYFTAIPADAGLNKVTIDAGVARVDFDEKFNFQVGGACQIQTIRAQVEETMKQFSTVKKVILSVNGQTELILEP